MTGSTPGVGAPGAAVGVDEVDADRLDLDLGRAGPSEQPRDSRHRFALLLPDTPKRGAAVKAEQLRALVARTVEAYGPPDILVNNTGIFVADDPLELSEDDWQRTMSVDLEGVWWLTREVLPHMLERGGAVINMASRHSFQRTTSERGLRSCSPTSDWACFSLRCAESPG